jgi:hypothetical protein
MFEIAANTTQQLSSNNSHRSLLALNRRLTCATLRLKSPENRTRIPDMSFTQPTPPEKFPPQRISMEQVCKHPRVRVVAREEDAEFVECEQCGEVFESSEFKDMAIEEKTRAAEL